MNKVDGTKIVNFIEGYYRRKLEKNEIIALSIELKDFTYEDFIEKFKKPLLKRVEYFSVAQLSQIIQDYREKEKLKERLGINDFEELYEN